MSGPAVINLFIMLQYSFAFIETQQFQFHKQTIIHHLIIWLVRYLDRNRISISFYSQFFLQFTFINKKLFFGTANIFLGGCRPRWSSGLIRHVFQIRSWMRKIVGSNLGSAKLDRCLSFVESNDCLVSEADWKMRIVKQEVIRINLLRLEFGAIYHHLCAILMWIYKRNIGFRWPEEEDSHYGSPT